MEFILWKDEGREAEEQGADLEQEDRGPRERMFWKKGEYLE